MRDSSVLIHEGILRENKQMARQGANFILNHPVPNHQPWANMAAPDQVGFKRSLLSFDKILDTHARRAARQADQENRLEASQALGELNPACISCHALWKQKVQ